MEGARPLSFGAARGPLASPRTLVLSGLWPRPSRGQEGPCVTAFGLHASLGSRCSLRAKTGLQKWHHSQAQPRLCVHSWAFILVCRYARRAKSRVVRSGRPGQSGSHQASLFQAHRTVWSCLGRRPLEGSELQTQPGLSDLSSAFSSVSPFSLEHLSALDLLTHSFTHSLIHSLIHSLTHSFTHSFTHSLTHSFIQLLLTLF